MGYRMIDDFINKGTGAENMEIVVEPPYLTKLEQRRVILRFDKQVPNGMYGFYYHQHPRVRAEIVLHPCLKQDVTTTARVIDDLLAQAAHCTTYPARFDNIFDLDLLGRPD